MNIRTSLSTLIFCTAVFCNAVTHAQGVRVINGNVCGSGTICGSDTQYSYVLTNAHVAGTSVGRTMTIRTVVAGVDREFPASVLVAAYSDAHITDWAILRTPKIDVMEWKLSKKDPSGTTFQTCGSPRCVWPLVCSTISSVDIGHGSNPWRWTPDAIGGQSGSSVRDNAVAFGLLTWSWGGRGAGQLTSTIYRQMQERSNVSPARPVGLREVQFAERHETTNGYHDGDVSTRIALPIWILDDVPPPIGDCHELTDNEWKIIQLIRERSNASLDWSRLIALLLELLSMFRKS